MLATLSINVDFACLLNLCLFWGKWRHVGIVFLLNTSYLWLIRCKLNYFFDFPAYCIFSYCFHSLFLKWSWPVCNKSCFSCCCMGDICCSYFFVIVVLLTFLTMIVFPPIIYLSFHVRLKDIIGSRSNNLTIFSFTFKTEQYSSIICSYLGHC